METKLVKVKLTHEKLRIALGMPDDVKITSIYTERHGRNRRDTDSWIYMTSDRFGEANYNEEAQEIQMRDVHDFGMWDGEDNG